MRIEYLLLAAVVVYAIVAIARSQNRSAADKAKPSWAVRGWNASGAPKVESTRLFPAMRELAGRGIGHMTGRAQQAVKAKWDAGADRREARAEAQREVITEVKDAARQAAVRRARAVSEAAKTRWDTHAPSWARRGKPAEGDPGQPTTDGPEPSTDDTSAPAEGRRRSGRYWDRTTGTWRSAEDDRPELSASAACGNCDAMHAATIPAGQDGVEVACGCGTKLFFFRRRPEDPVVEGSRPAAMAAPDAQPVDASALEQASEQAKPTLRLVPEEDTTMSHTATAPQPEAGTATATLAAHAPADWATVAGRVADFHPENDADLINFMTSEVAGICGYAEAFEVLHSACVDGLGLDPTSVNGLGEFSGDVMELTQRMVAAHKQFLTTYQEVMEAVRNGVVLPYNGRWMTGEAV